MSNEDEIEIGLNSMIALFLAFFFALTLFYQYFYVFFYITNYYFAVRVNHWFSVVVLSMDWVRTISGVQSFILAVFLSFYIVSKILSWLVRGLEKL